MHVFRSMLLDAPLPTVWALVRPFHSVAQWNPAVAAAHMETGTHAEPGSIRHLDIADGSVFRETLLELSDRDHFYTYDILDSPLPLRNYISRHSFIPVTATDQTLSIWEGWFDCDTAVAADMERIVGDDIYAGGMAGLAAVLTEAQNV